MNYGRGKFDRKELGLLAPIEMSRRKGPSTPLCNYVGSRAE